MQTDVGAVLKGKVTGITKYGVFVELETGKTGMVHISEVASAYVKEIRDYVEVGQEVSVKVITIADDGKIALSMKQAQPQAQPQTANARPRVGATQSASSAYPPRGRFGAPQQKSGGDSFDDMLSRFMQSSDEKMVDLRRSTGERRTSRKGSSR